MNRNVIFEYVLKPEEYFVLENEKDGIKLAIVGSTDSLNLFASEKKVNWKSTLDAEEKKLFEELRVLRRKLSDSEGVRPYMIFNDKTLAEMSKFKPTSDEELLMINGVGPAKLEKYGNLFLDTIICWK